jgi:hypothetical protein
MTQFNVFLYYSYADAVNQTLQTILTLPEFNLKLDPVVVSKLQLQTVSLEYEPYLGEDFLFIKTILSDINNLLALWVNTGVPEEDFVVFIIDIILILLLELLFNNYNELENICGFDFDRDELKFILIGQSLENDRNNAVKLVKNSSVMNLVVDDKEKLVESVLAFGNLSSKFSHDDVLRVIAKLN